MKSVSQVTGARREPSRMAKITRDLSDIQLLQNAAILLVQCNAKARMAGHDVCIEALRTKERCTTICTKLAQHFDQFLVIVLAMEEVPRTTSDPSVLPSH